MGKCKKKRRQFYRWYKKREKYLMPVLAFFAAAFELINAVMELVSHWGTLILVAILFLLYLFGEYRLCECSREGKRKYKKKDKKLRDEIKKEQGEEERQQIYDKQKKMMENHNQYQASIQKSRWFVRVMFGAGICLGLFVFAKGVFAGKQEIGMAVMTKSESGMGENKDGKRILEEVVTEATAGKVENTIIVNGEKEEESGGEIPDINFILDDPDRLEILSDEMIEEVFYVSCISPEKNSEEVKSHMESIWEGKREDTSGNASEIEKRVIDEASDAETIFEKDIERAAECRSRNDLEGWRNHVPHSSYLENNIMDVRGQFWNLEEPIFGSSLAFMMGNSYQKMADEYKLQNGRPETVIYNWVKSIMWTTLGLSYENLTEKDKKEYYNYLKSRYKDIYDYIEAHKNEPWAQEGIYKEIKEKAYAIYSCL